MRSRNKQRHSSTSKPSPLPALAPSNSRTSVVQMKSKTCIGHNTFSSNSKPLRMPKDNLHTSINKQQHTGFPSRDTPCVPVPVVSLKKIPNLKAGGANIKMNSTTTTTSTSSASSSITWSSALVKTALTSTASKPAPSSLEKTLNGKGIVPPSLLDKKHQNGTKSSYKPNRRISEREFDPNKYCGVLNPETKKPCTRSLTCKTHSLNHRRAVQGRQKRFDILLAEHKARRTREKEAIKDIEPQVDRKTSQSAQSQAHVAGSIGNSGLENKIALSTKSRPSNSYISRPSYVDGLSSSACGGLVHEHIVSAVGGDVESRLSSDEGETDGAEESHRLDCHYSRHHPRPLGFCTFGTRAMGRGYYVFDRRWDQFCFALNSMVEKHLNSQMWKKIPPAADSPMPAHTTASFPVLQSFNSASVVYLSSSAVRSSITPSYVMNAPILSPTVFVNTSDRNPGMTYTTAFPQQGADFSLMDPPFMCPVPAPSRYKPSRTKSSKSLKVSYSLGNKKKKSANASTPSPLLTTALSFAGSHKRNCVSALNSYQISSCNSSVSVHNNHNWSNPLRTKSEPSGRTSLSGSSADSVKHMSMVVSSIDPNLSVSSLMHHSGGHTLSTHNVLSSVPLSFEKSEGKKRKNSSKSIKTTKMPGINSVHRKRTAVLLSAVPESPNSSVPWQVRKDLI
ncbi:ataxin-7-like protein 1 isoform X1 [Polyodon spathula]|uniref:ataxin-7-like protein 1 isoform X1 n=1 Tax=Polyodon spathula TaxID=7913 RepID=UPI001B7EF960|nr:ataxin-7-like protein 1 isoform X1 [Polyodon spathula]XP_041113552.1 ataxin-7-like protein 1 isoform X1 [Polyodon spathula]XP_041113553.1 ataxin-7-like protein 1 isoform X1 [Polyodon spathula]XP_041113554.1 ataxin-7-like protein 1 isoform X1 [Polyodon spathula]XP_041113555.1 ataxin-7-like protein 1 isoform X1 [Polyodon spathula]